MFSFEEPVRFAARPGYIWWNVYALYWCPFGEAAVTWVEGAKDVVTTKISSIDYRPRCS